MTQHQSSLQAPHATLLSAHNDFNKPQTASMKPKCAYSADQRNLHEITAQPPFLIIGLYTRPHVNTNIHASC